MFAWQSGSIRYNIGSTKEQAKSYHRQFDWPHPRVVAKVTNLKERKIRESLNKLEAKAVFDDSFKVFSHNRGNDFWNALEVNYIFAILTTHDIWKYIDILPGINIHFIK